MVPVWPGWVRIRSAEVRSRSRGARGKGLASLKDWSDLVARPLAVAEGENWAKSRGTSFQFSWSDFCKPHFNPSLRVVRENLSVLIQR